jgi:hypothetical protein
MAFSGRIRGERSAAAFSHWAALVLSCIVYDMDDHIQRWSIGVWVICMKHAEKVGWLYNYLESYSASEKEGCCLTL